MSREEENASLLANMAETPEGGEDVYADMQAMMGFSSFGGPQKPKRQPKIPGDGRGFGTGANSQPIRQRDLSTSTTKSFTGFTALSQPFVPASLPPRPARSASYQSSGLNSDFGSSQNMTQPGWPSPPSTIVATAPSLTSNMYKASASTPATSTLTSDHAPDTRDISETLAWSETSQDFQRQSEKEIAYTHPETGYTFTQQQLSAYERGVVESRPDRNGTEMQVKVYFKPNFIDENPWQELEDSIAKLEGVTK